MIIEGTGISYLTYLSLDGSAVKRLTPDYSRFVGWGFNYNSIVYYQGSNSNGNQEGSYQIKFDGTGIQSVTPKWFLGIWSPDDKWVLTDSYPLTIVKADGSETKDLKQDGAIHETLSWSPDGKWIIFYYQGDYNNEHYDIYRINIYTNKVERLTNLEYETRHIGWLDDPIDLPWHREWLMGLAIGGIVLSLALSALSIVNHKGIVSM